MNRVRPITFQYLFAEVFHDCFGHFFENFAPHDDARLLFVSTCKFKI